MKQKIRGNKTNNSTSSVVRTIFHQELKNFEKNVDKKFFSFETKMDLKLENLEKAVDSKLENLEKAVDSKLENLERRIDEKARQYRDEILTSNDKLAKKFETTQQELELGNLQMRKQLENHEERITTLESSQKS